MIESVNVSPIHPPSTYTTPKDSTNYTQTPGAAMADPTKAETEQVFKILKAQKGNKVRRKMLGTMIDHGY